MADAVVSRLGQANASGSTDALFLKVFSGEVIMQFGETNVSLERTMVRTIDHGLSAQFPVFGKGGSEYHTPGTEILGSVVPHNEKVITIDDMLIAPRFIAKIDEAKNHYDVRAPYSKDVGRSLARSMDINVFRASLLNARASAAVSGGFGGTQITASTAATSASALIAAAFLAAQTFDEKDVPPDERYFFVRPAQYNLLVNSGSTLINRDFSPANGSVADGVVYKVAGMEIVKTNNLPSTNVTTGPTAYRGDFRYTVALAQHKTAVGTVKLLDLNTEMAYDIRRQGTLIVAKYAVGHGGLRPEASVEIITQ